VVALWLYRHDRLTGLCRNRAGTLELPCIACSGDGPVALIVVERERGIFRRRFACCVCAAVRATCSLAAATCAGVDCCPAKFQIASNGPGGSKKVPRRNLRPSKERKEAVQKTPRPIRRGRFDTAQRLQQNLLVRRDRATSNVVRALIYLKSILKE
jgi:hypothetical protein